jgi:hypothetical protein
MFYAYVRIRLSLGLDDESANTVRTPNHSHGTAPPPEDATIQTNSLSHDGTIMLAAP